MILWLLPRLLGLGAWMKEAARYLLAHPLVLVCCILATTTFVYRGKALHCHQAVIERDATIAAMKAAHDQAETHYRQEADHAERFHTMVADSGPVLVAAYAGPRRVQPAPADAPAQGDGAGLPEVAPALPAVAVPESVLNTCDADYAYALSAHEWAKQFVGGE